MLRTAHITSEHQPAQHTRASHFAFTSFLTKLPTNPHFPHPHTIHNSRFIVLPDPVNRVNFPLFTLLTCPNVTGSSLVPSFNLDPPIFPHNEASPPYKPHHHIMYLRFSDLLGFRSVQNSFSLSLSLSLSLCSLPLPLRSSPPFPFPLQQIQIHALFHRIKLLRDSNQWRRILHSQDSLFFFSCSFP